MLASSAYVSIKVGSEDDPVTGTGRVCGLSDNSAPRVTTSSPSAVLTVALLARVVSTCQAKESWLSLIHI